MRLRFKGWIDVCVCFDVRLTIAVVCSVVWYGAVRCGVTWGGVVRYDVVCLLCTAC